MAIYSIYKATNKLTGKAYIGFTQEFKNRISSHKKRYKVKKSKFYDAIKSYGWDNFEWEVIYQSLERKYCLDVMEQFFIVEYDTFNNGYNMTKGGEGLNNDSISIESRQKMSAASIKRWSNSTTIPMAKSVSCTHCGKTGGSAIMHRWHFDNCKNKVL